ncbi:metallophosphoesterase family protein [Candidatus Stoquefichus sp. SB1]|uniref:metallophosphoesterase family protein n=1 Tax=Candidatus Stoquefichus sp. SB1 TaxID=1658109 RepID=UPI00067EA7ED|nr:metallophosphoesterase [Candidatus Stoquefichus sp. SB1]
MKKIVVMSDNHGDDRMLEYVRECEPHADYYIHCGDSEAYHKEMLSGYICVKGNNDWALDLPQEAHLVIEDMPIIITHGQHFSMFNRELAMHDFLTRNHCQLLLFGHTHMPLFQREGDYYYINPGSTSLPRGGSDRSYAVVTIDQQQVTCEFKKIEL